MKQLNKELKGSMLRMFEGVYKHDVPADDITCLKYKHMIKIKPKITNDILFGIKSKKYLIETLVGHGYREFYDFEVSTTYQNFFILTNSDELATLAKLIF